jgi:hypothetical protein
MSSAKQPRNPASPRPARDPVPPLARDVLELFRGPLEAVRFPDVDRAALDLGERELLDAQVALEEAELALERARAVVLERSGALAARAQRALAYARVFAEDDAALRERVSAIGGAPTAATAPAPRKRRSKKNEDGASLFAAGPAEDGVIPDADAA